MDNMTDWLQQDTADYGRPVVVVVETGLQSQDEGPVMDPDSVNTLRTEVSFSLEKVYALRMMICVTL